MSFGTDAWTSPNHKAYITVTVHLEREGVPLCLLLDIIEVACSHSGANLANAFATILGDFGIADKVSLFTKININEDTQILTHKILSITCNNASANNVMIDHLAIILDTFPGSAN